MPVHLSSLQALYDHLLAWHMAHPEAFQLDGSTERKTNPGPAVIFSVSGFSTQHGATIGVDGDDFNTVPGYGRPKYALAGDTAVAAVEVFLRLFQEFKGNAAEIFTLAISNGARRRKKLALSSGDTGWQCLEAQ